MKSILLPETEQAAGEIVREAAATGTTLRIIGGGSELPLQGASDLLSSRALTGITHYEPADFVVSARAGTPVSELAGELARHRQRLPFEPPDRRLFFGTRGKPTLGGVVASNRSGPRRPFVGDARAHLVGLRMVNGRGEVIRAGGHTLKNVAGLDLGRLLAGSCGSLGLLTEVSLRVEAVPETECTLAIGIECADLPLLMARARASGIRASAASCLCAATVARAELAGLPQGQPVALVRFEGRAPAVAEHVRRFRDQLTAIQDAHAMDDRASSRVWEAVRDLEAFAGRGARDTVRLAFPHDAELHMLQQAAADGEHQVQVDWCGRQAWIAGPSARSLARFESAPARLQALIDSIRDSFDPQRVFEAGMFDRAETRQEAM